MVRKRDGQIEITFRYRTTPGKRVSVAGSFNAWDINANVMRDVGGGTYEATVTVNPGRYQYKFVVDGHVWTHDPDNNRSEPDGHGGRNSVVTVLEDGSVAIPGSVPEPVPDPAAPALEAHIEPGAKPLHVAILWHQHQPRYLKDPDTGEYLEPWVRIDTSSYHCIGRASTVRRTEASIGFTCTEMWRPRSTSPCWRSRASRDWSDPRRGTGCTRWT